MEELSVDRIVRLILPLGGSRLGPIGHVLDD